MGEERGLGATAAVAWGDGSSYQGAEVHGPPRDAGDLDSRQAVLPPEMPRLDGD